MKKILFFIMLTTVSVVFTTCYRNELYIYKDDPMESLLFLINDPGTPPAAIYIYNAGMYTGTLSVGGRIGADSLCLSGAPPGTTTYHAFLSVSASDQVRDLLDPAYWYLSIPVYGTGTNIISTSWAGLWDGFIDMPLHSNAGGAGVLPWGYPWWSGSNADGTFNSSCGGWLGAGSSINGVPNYSNSSWINGMTQTCTATCYVLCVAY